MCADLTQVAGHRGCVDFRDLVKLPGEEKKKPVKEIKDLDADY